MQAIDEALLRTMFGWGEAVPLLRAGARWLTELGGVRWLVPLTIVVALSLILRSQWRRGVALLAVTLGGRVLIEAAKWLLNRPRPALFDHQVSVQSLSLPSGHAANSTIVYLALAMIAAPLLTSRPWPLVTAAMLSVGIGLTRPLLGVHWPSDVLAGWALGLAWTLTTVWLLGRWMQGQPVSRPPPSV